MRYLNIRVDTLIPVYAVFTRRSTFLCFLVACGTVLTEILRNYQYELSQPINQSMQKHAKSYSPACEKDWKCASKMEEQGLNTKTLLKDRKSAS